MTGPIVPAQPPRKVPCPIAFLGEAPSDDEEEKGKPLVGPSGKVFDAALRTAGLDRAEYWVGNVFDRKAPDNDCAPWMADPDIANAALERLAAELNEVRPTVVVPMGGTALWAMTGSTKITQMRGAVSKATQTLPGVKMVPSFHPAHVMRDWRMLATMVKDFIKADREAKRGPEVVFPKKELWLCPTLNDISAFWHKHLKGSDLVSVDIETGWGQMTCIGFAGDSTHAMCVPFVDLRKPNKSYWGSVEKEMNAMQLVKAIVESPVPKVGQNYASYDAYWLLDKWGIRTMNLTDDTRLLHHALYPELPKDLQFMGAAYTDQGVWKTWGGKGEKSDD